MQKPEFKIVMPESFERAASIAIDNNPSILVGRYNTKGAQSLMRERTKGYYPKVDLEVSQSYNDVHHTNGFDQPDDRFRARLVLNYNLYKGGADRAEELKGISTINQETQTMLESKRQALEGIEFSWNAYQYIEKQLVDLRRLPKILRNDPRTLQRRVRHGAAFDARPSGGPKRSDRLAPEHHQRAV
jgi:outer membrane protein, adhesin transport system